MKIKPIKNQMVRRILLILTSPIWFLALQAHIISLCWHYYRHQFICEISYVVDAWEWDGKPEEIEVEE